MRRVLFLSPWFPNVPGDREGNYVYESARSLIKAGVNVAVLVARPWLRKRLGQERYRALSERFDPAAFSAFSGVRVAHYLSIPGNRAPRLSAWLHDRVVGKALFSLAESFTPDLIHAHTEGEAPVAVHVGRQLNLPVVVTLHGINTAARYFDQPFLRARFKAPLAAADRIILVGEPLKSHFVELVGDAKNFRVIPNGFEPPVMPARAPIAQERAIRFISVANLHEGKGVDIALKALEEARRRGLDHFTYTIVGDGLERESLEALANQLGLQGVVRFAGACPHDQVYEYLRVADVFLLPSYREAFGVAYLEAMAAGLLAIGVEGEGPSAFIDDRKTGVLVPPRDIDGLAECLAALAKDRSAMQAIAAAGQAYVTDNLTWDHHAQKLIALYAEVTKS